MSRPARAHGPGEGADSVTRLLCHGDIVLKGRIPWSSNATFLVEVQGSGASTLAIYKPAMGERGLWDFERGLWRREVAAYRLALHLGWDLVPVTVGRSDGPLGEGSLQHLVEADPDAHYFTLLEDSAHHRQLKRMAVFDVVTNNADRKAGHCLLDEAGHIWAIDHGLTFHQEPKLRTVIWDWAGEPVPAELLDDLVGLAAHVPPSVAALLEGPEVAALATRAARLCRRRRFPRPSGEFPYPWPLV